MATERIETVVTMKHTAKFSVPSFNGWGYEDKYIYSMEDESGKVYVWKTTAFFTIKVEDEKNGWEIDTKGRKWAHWAIHDGDVIRIKATIKGESEYNGQPQTELTRVVCVERLFKAKTAEEIAQEREEEKKRKKQEQLDSLKDGDILYPMLYSQYKEHYADCETLIGSYDKRDYAPAEITVIVRAGRLVPSGVRGQHFHGYEFFVFEDGKKYRACYRAVSEENALRRLSKDHPNATEVIPGKIYDYGA